MFNPYLLRLDPINLLNVNLLYSETFVERVVKDREQGFPVCVSKLKEKKNELPQTTERMWEILKLRGV